MPEITCPLCHTEVPTPVSDQPNSQGLSTGIDDSYVEEHMEMHRTCRCYWGRTGIVFFDADCPAHSAKQVV